MFGALTDDDDSDDGGVLNKSGTSGASGGGLRPEDESEDSDNDELMDALGGADEVQDDEVIKNEPFKISPFCQRLLYNYTVAQCALTLCNKSMAF